MLDIDFGYSIDSIGVDIKLTSDSEVNFYVLHKNKKIYIKYLKGRHVVIPKNIVENKKVFFQIYWKDKSTSKQFKSELIIYNEIDKSLYSGIIGSNDYESIKNNGYISVDGKMSLKIDENIKWHTGNRNFDFNVNALRFLSSYWKRFFDKFEVYVLEEIISILTTYYNHMNSKESKSNRFIWYDMAVGIRALHISLALNFRSIISDEQTKVLEGLYNSHLNKLLEEKFFTLNNHGIWQIYGLRILLYVKNDTDKNSLDYCNKRFSELVDFSFNNEGIHTENSPFYHQYVIDLFRKVPRKFLRENKKISSIISDSIKFSAWLSDSNLHFFQIGDTEGYSRYSLMLDNIDIDFEINESKSISKIFFDSGYFTTKLYDKYDKCISELIFYNTSGSISHKHLDGNSFILIHNGIELFTDAGKYTYDHNKLRKYFLSFDAHNTVHLKDFEISLESLNLQKTGFQSFNKKQGVYKLNSLVSYDKYMEHEREITFKPTRSLEVVDRIYNNEGSLVVNFLFGTDIEVIDLSYEGFIILEYKGRVVAKMSIQKDFISCKTHFGSEDPYKGWVSKQYSILKPTNSLQLVYSRNTNKVITQIVLF